MKFTLYTDMYYDDDDDTHYTDVYYTHNFRGIPVPYHKIIADNLTLGLRSRNCR